MVVIEIEYRSVIKCFVLRNTPRPQIIQMLQETYKEECPANRTIYKWIAEFKAGRINVQDDSRPGRPIEIDEEKRRKIWKS